MAVHGVGNGVRDDLAANAGGALVEFDLGAIAKQSPFSNSLDAGFLRCGGLAPKDPGVREARIGRDDLVVVVVGVQDPAHRHLLEVVQACDSLALFAGPAQRGHEDGHEDGDDGDHDKQLDEGEGVSLGVHMPFSCQKNLWFQTPAPLYQRPARQGKPQLAAAGGRQVEKEGASAVWTKAPNRSSSSRPVSEPAGQVPIECLRRVCASEPSCRPARQSRRRPALRCRPAPHRRRQGRRLHCPGACPHGRAPAC